MKLTFFKKMTLLFLFSLYKLNSRNSTLSKTAGVADGSRRAALMKVTIQGFMSSEENGDEMIDGKRRAVIKVKSLSWRFSRIGWNFKRLYHKIEKRKSKQQTVLHVIGNRYLR